MPQDLYQYETMIDRALRGVVREALERAAREGLRGAHHFYVGFATEMPGVSIPDSLRERYPQEMTIVLQHQYLGPRGRAGEFLGHAELPEAARTADGPVRGGAQLRRPLGQFRARIRAVGAAEAAPSLVPAPTAVPGPTPISTIGPVAPPAKPAETGAEQPQEKTGAEVVTLDSFRKR